MNTRAPELRALIIIFGSAGPVISTRRSSRSAGAGATRQSAARTSAVATGKSGISPASSSSGGPRGLEQRDRARAEAPVQVGDEREGSGVRISSAPATRRVISIDGSATDACYSAGGSQNVASTTALYRLLLHGAFGSQSPNDVHSRMSLPNSRRGIFHRGSDPIDRAIAVVPRPTTVPAGLLVGREDHRERAEVVTAFRMGPGELAPRSPSANSGEPLPCPPRS